MKINSIAVFCASSDGNKAVYRDTAFQLGVALAKRNITLIYGGATVGSMGAVAEGALSENGKVIGVLPHFLDKREIAHFNLTELIMVESMHERKLKMNELSDAFITLPGGFGSMEELFEIITWGQLGLHKKASVLFNVNSYYDHMVAQLKHMNQEGMLKQEYLDMLMVSDSVEDTLNKIDNYKAPELEAWLTEKKT